MKKVLITGATGFIGRHCLPFLLERGFEIHAVSSRRQAEAPRSVFWHQADLMNFAEVGTLVTDVKPTHLLHFAWITTPKEYWVSSENLRWVLASVNLLQAFVAHGGQRVVKAGTCAEYDWRYGYSAEYLTPLAPATLYGACKHSLQVMLDAYAKQAGLSAAWGRVFFVYGPHEHSQRLVPTVIRSLLKGEQARCSQGDQVRDFLYVEDIAEAFVALLESDIGGAVNIASGVPLRLRDMICVIAEALNRRNLVQLGALPTSSEEPPFLVADVNRLTKEVGWRPRYSLEKGLQQTIAWWKSQL